MFCLGKEQTQQYRKREKHEDVNYKKSQKIQGNCVCCQATYVIVGNKSNQISEGAGKYQLLSESYVILNSSLCSPKYQYQILAPLSPHWQPKVRTTDSEPCNSSLSKLRICPSAWDQTEQSAACQGLQLWGRLSRLVMREGWTLPHYVDIVQH